MLLGSTFRALLRRPGYPVAASLIMAFGVGSATAVFAVVEAALLQPLPFAAAERIVIVRSVSAGSASGRLDAPAVPLLAAAAPSLDEWGYILRSGEAAFDSEGAAVPVSTNTATAGLFDLLGVRPAAGRFPGEADALAADPADPTPEPIVLSHGFWVRRFGASADVVGRVLRIDDASAIIAAVLPEGFRLPLPADAGITPNADVWRPIRTPLEGLARTDRLRDQDSDDRGIALARLVAGADIERARLELDRAAGSQAWRTMVGSEVRIRAAPLRAEAVARIRPLLLLLTITIAVVLLLAVSSVAGLLATRMSARRREFAVRSALGASSVQIVAPLFAEAVILSALTAALGAVVAAWGVSGLLALWPAALPLPTDLRLRGGVFLFGVGAAIAGTFAATLLPARAVWGGAPWRGSAASLRVMGTAGTDRRLLRHRDAFVVLEIALSVTLLTCVALLVRTAAEMRSIQPGFRADGAAAFDLALVYRDGYRGPADRGAFVRHLEERLRALPGVEQAGVIAGAPLSGEAFTQPWGLPGQAIEAWEGRAQYRVVSAGYFDAIGTSVLTGRPFDAGDDRQDRRVVIVDETLARRIAPGGGAGDRDPTTAAARALGRHIAVPVDGVPVIAEIIGVVEAVRFTDLRASGPPTVYVPYRHEASRRLTVIVRAAHPSSLAPAVTELIRQADPRLPVFDFRLLRDHIDAATADLRFALFLLTAFALTAVLVATAGLHALVSFTTERRLGELGVRMLLGATRATITGMILRQALRLAVIGIPVGVLAALATGWGMRGLLYGVSAADPLAYLGVCMLLLTVVLLAALGPAWRAASMEPAQAIRRGIDSA